VPINSTSRPPKNCPLIKPKNYLPKLHFERMYILRHLYGLYIRNNANDKLCFEKYYSIVEMQDFFEGERLILDEDIIKFCDCLQIPIGSFNKCAMYKNN
jgi:hypothetical protein